MTLAYPSLRGWIAVLAAAIPCLAGAQCEPPVQPEAVHEEAQKTSSVRACERVTAESVSNRIASITVVDVRDSSSPTHVRMNEALPIEQALSHAKSRPMMLVGSGWNSIEEQRACGRMQEAGFNDVAVMDGGLRAWVRAGFPIWASASELQALDQLTPSAAHAAALRGDIELFVVRGQGLPLACPPEATHIHCVDTWQDVADGARQCQSQKTIVVASETSRPSSMSQLQSVMAVIGGAEALRRHLDQYQSIAQSAGQSLWIPCHRR